MISLPSLLLCGVYCASLVAGDSSFTSPAELDDAGTWNPAQNQILKVGDFFDIAWTTTEEIVTLIINQDNSPSTQIDYLPNSQDITQKSFNWKVTIDGSDGQSTFDLTFNNQFNFMLYKINGTAPIAVSNYFNVTNSTINQYGQKTSSSATSSPVSLTSSPTSSPTSLGASTTSVPAVSITGKTGGPTTSSSPSPTATATPSPGLSGGAKAGIGIGAALGALAVVGALAFFFWRKRKNGSKIEPKYELPPNQAQAQPYNGHQSYYEPPKENWGGNGPAEMLGQEVKRPVELPYQNQVQASPHMHASELA